MAGDVALARTRDLRGVRIGGAAVLIGTAIFIGVFGASAFHPHVPRLDLLWRASPVIQVHLATALLAAALGVVQLAGPKGTTWHRRIGWAWVILMGTVAGSSFLIPILGAGRWGPIHALSGFVAIMLPLGVRAARRHDVVRHGNTMLGLFLGALIIAGLFTLAPGRLLHAVFFG